MVQKFEFSAVFEKKILAWKLELWPWSGLLKWNPINPNPNFAEIFKPDQARTRTSNPRVPEVLILLKKLEKYLFREQKTQTFLLKWIYNVTISTIFSLAGRKAYINIELENILKKKSFENGSFWQNCHIKMQSKQHTETRETR